MRDFCRYIWWVLFRRKAFDEYMKRKNFRLGKLSLKISRWAIFSSMLTVTLTALLAVAEHTFWNKPLEDQFIEQHLNFSDRTLDIMDNFVYAVCDWWMVFSAGFIFLAWGIATVAGLFVGTDIND